MSRSSRYEQWKISQTLKSVCKGDVKERKRTVFLVSEQISYNTFQHGKLEIVL